MMVLKALFNKLLNGLRFLLLLACYNFRAQQQTPATTAASLPVAGAPQVLGPTAPVAVSAPVIAPAPDAQIAKMTRRPSLGSDSSGWDLANGNTEGLKIYKLSDGDRKDDLDEDQISYAPSICLNTSGSRVPFPIPAALVDIKPKWNSQNNNEMIIYGQKVAKGGYPNTRKEPLARIAFKVITDRTNEQAHTLRCGFLSSVVIKKGLEGAEARKKECLERANWHSFQAQGNLLELLFLSSTCAIFSQNEKYVINNHLIMSIYEPDPSVISNTLNQILRNSRGIAVKDGTIKNTLRFKFAVVEENGAQKIDLWLCSDRITNPAQNHVGIYVYSDTVHNQKTIWWVLDPSTLSDLLIQRNHPIAEDGEEEESSEKNETSGEEK